MVAIPPWFNLPHRDPHDDDADSRGLMHDTQRRCSYCRGLLLGDEPPERTTCARHRQLERLRDVVHEGVLSDWPQTHHLAALEMTRRAGAPGAQAELTQIVVTACHFLGWKPWQWLP